MSRIKRSDRAVEEMASAVMMAELAFEGRWTKLALRRVNPDLANRLDRQKKLWHKARAADDPEESLRQGQGMLRGLAVCVQAMDSVDEPDDACLFGQARDGRVVSFGSAASAQQVVERFPGKNIPHFTLDEAADVLLGLRRVDSFKAVSAVMGLFPGAEIVEVRRTRDECASS